MCQQLGGDLVTTDTEQDWTDLHQTLIKEVDATGRRAAVLHTSVARLVCVNTALEVFLPLPSSLARMAGGA